MAERMLAPKPSLTAGRSVFAYTRPIAGVPRDAPDVIARSFTVTAEIEVGKEWAYRMLNTNGGRRIVRR